MQKLWILGEAVQDLTVEIDLELLMGKQPAIGDSLRLDEVLWIKDGLWFTTQAGARSFAVQMRLRNPKASSAGLVALLPGDKYNLDSAISESLDGIPPEIPLVSVRLENMSWGGGGVNVARYIRAIAPLPELVPIVYTDIAMNPSLDEQLRQDVASPQSNLVHLLASYSSDRYLDVYLDSLAIEPVPYRPVHPEFRRNLVISRVRASNRETDNKIVCRGSAIPDTSDAEETLLKLLNGHAQEIGAILVDSVKSKELFNAAYSVCKQNASILAIFALSESMQPVAAPLIEDLKRGEPPSNCILIFNEKEIHEFAKRFKPDIKPFMTKPEDVPNLRLFADTVAAILEKCPFNRRLPRIYTTLGPRGSLGFDHQAQIVYVSTFTKQKAMIFDTNTCGDAFCAGIALLEWAKRCGMDRASLAPENARSWDEMRYFMAVGTAAAYSRATSRLGSLDRREVEDLLRRGYLASEWLGHFDELREGKSRLGDKDGYLMWPRNATVVGVEPGLARLMSTERARSQHTSA